MNQGKTALVQYSDSDEDIDLSAESTANAPRAGADGDLKKSASSSTARCKQEEDGAEHPTKRKFVDVGNLEIKKKKMPLALPKDIKLMFEDPDSVEENPNSDGRIRSFPHVDGDWASFVFVPVNSSPPLLRILKRVTDKASLVFPELHAFEKDELHITLSRTVSLRHYWIETMVSKLRESFSCSRSFSYHLDLPELYTNDEKTRTFLGLRVILGEEKLEQLSRKVDQVFSEFGLASYYENPSFHMSIAWNVGDVTNVAPSTLQEDLQDVLESDNEVSDCRTLTIKKILFKTGNKIYCLKDFTT